MKPTTVNIMGIPYNVRYDNNAATIASISIDGFHGYINYVTREISLLSSQPKEALEKTLVHEILHGIFYALHMPEWNDEEEKLDRLASALYDTLVRNGWLKFDGE